MAGRNANAPVARMSVSRPSNAVPNAANPRRTSDTGMVKNAAIDLRLSCSPPMVETITNA
jgi:hypothetical protein